MRKACTNIYQTCPEDVRIDSKINENRHQEGPKIDENRWLDGSWSSVRRLWRACARIFWKVAGKMREASAKMAANCAQDGPRWRQDGHLGLNFGGFGAILGVTWHMAGTVKTLIFLRFFKGFSLFGRLGGACWDILATMLDDIGPKMRPRWV